LLFLASVPPLQTIYKMLIQLEVSNFRSFHGQQVFHMLKRNVEKFSEHICEFQNKVEILKTAAIYGANASGKTNLFKALYFVKMMIQESDYLHSIEAIKMFTPYRLNDDSEFKDSKFSITFISNNRIFKYILEVNSVTKIVTYESLSELTNSETLIFSRKTNSNNENILEFTSQDTQKKFSELFSSHLPTRHSPLLSNIYVTSFFVDLEDARKWFVDKIKFSFPVHDYIDITYVLSQNDQNLELANKIISFSKTGIDKIKIDKIPIEIYFGTESASSISQIELKLKEKKYHPFKGANSEYCTAIKDSENKIFILKLVTIHIDKNKKEVPFSLDQESRGTIALFHIIPAFILSYSEGINYFIDEIGASLHPILIREILKQYLTYNIEFANGQLIFNTHEDFILDPSIVRQDEIWLVEREEDETSVFPLTDFQDLIFDQNIRKNYLNGYYGAVPFENEPQKLIFKD
jgi:AAA15 family ATPase/GTPase